MSNYFFALATALFWAMTPSLAKIGLSGGFPPTAGTFVSMLASIPMLYLVLKVLKKGNNWGCLDRRAIFLSVGVGVATSLGGFAYFTALTYGLVSVVVAVTSGVQPLLNLVFVVLLLKHEAITRMLVCGTLLVVLGTYLIIS